MRAVLLILTVSTFLSGCAALEDLDRRLTAALVPQPEVTVAASAGPVLPVPDRKPPAPPGAQRPAVAAAPPAAKAPEEAEGPEAEDAEQAEAPKRQRLPETLMGLSSDDIRARFGPPTALIEETPGITWRYRLPDCVVDLHLFPRVDSQGLYALDVSGQGLPVTDCLTRLAEAHETPADPDGADAGGASATSSQEVRAQDQMAAGGP